MKHKPHTKTLNLLGKSIATLLIAATNILLPPIANAEPAPKAINLIPLTQNGGSWHSGHVQGIAIDVKGGFIYYSFTNLLAKYDFKGNLIGTLVGWNGHLGDLDFNAEDGKVYGSLEYKKDNAFYIAVIDVDKINQIGISANNNDIFLTVYLPEVMKDYTATSSDSAKDLHKYGCSGIDGVAFGPTFGKTNGKNYLSVAYGIFGDNNRHDNDHQIILQYDISDWEKYQKPLSEIAPHHSGPDNYDGKYFVRTGNTTYGVQNLSYDGFSQKWFMGVYQGKKPNFPNYLLFAVDAKTEPKTSDLIGVSAPDNKWERGKLLTLSSDGLKDSTTQISGWNQKADVGFQPIGNGLFYIANNIKSQDGNGKITQSADLTLMKFVNNSQKPFIAAKQNDLEKFVK